MRHSQMPWLTCCLALVLVCGCSAYPELFVINQHANGCTSHPTGPLGEHGAPTPDKTTTFTLSKTGSTAPVTSLCPGVTYDLVVDYGGQRRRTLITASAGKFGSSGALPADPKCPNRAASADGSSPSYTNTLTLPCTAKGPSLLLNVTSSGRGSDVFHAASTTLPVNPISQCPGSTCPGAPSAAAAAAPATPAAAAPTAAAAEEDATPAVIATGKPAAAVEQRAAAPKTAGPGCAPSAYKYACAVNTKDGATLHYTKSDSPQPPENACTASAAAAAGSSAGQQQQQYLHMLLESPDQGYSGVGFSEQFGKMYPADAVIGYVDAASGKPVVSAYHLTNYNPTPSSVNSNGLGWATNLGAARAPSGSNGRSLLCFSRAVDAPTAAVSKKLDTSALNLNLVADYGTSFSQPHTLTHSLVLDVADGSLARSSSSSVGDKLVKQVAHGVLMLLAFVVFMPTGALMARHKWVMGDKAQGGIRAGWFHIHRAVQCLAVLLALAGFILALVSFNVPWSNMTADSTPHRLYNAHRVLGVVVIALSILQALGGMIRPGLTHKRRSNWRKGHTLMGWLALAAGVVVVLLGAVMMHDMADASYISWLLPILLLLGVLAVGGVIAEAYKNKLERDGSYDPSTHSFLPSGIHSPRSSGTGTPEAEISNLGSRPFATDKAPL